MIAHFNLTHHDGTSYAWSQCEHDPTRCPLGQLAFDLADAIVRLRCDGVPGLTASWRSKASGGGHTVPFAEEQLRTFIGLGFGLPADPMNPTHLEGSVAESLWFVLVNEFDHDDPIVYAVPPDLAPTDHGGDGFIVHRVVGGGVRYRLWEIKKYTGAGTVRATVRGACEQLNRKAAQYLARQIAAGQTHPDPDVSNLIQHALEHWYDGTPQAGVGVSVASAPAASANERFVNMDSHFDTLADATQFAGLVTNVVDFGDLAQRVQSALWTGL